MKHFISVIKIQILYIIKIFFSILSALVNFHQRPHCLYHLICLCTSNLANQLISYFHDTFNSNLNFLREKIKTNLLIEDWLSMFMQASEKLSHSAGEFWAKFDNQVIGNTSIQIFFCRLEISMIYSELIIN